MEETNKTIAETEIQAPVEADTQAAPAAGTESGAAAPPVSEEESPEKLPDSPPPEDIEAIKAENWALRAGTKPELTADVITLAKSYAKDGVTMEQAVKEVIKRYPAFKGEEPPGITASVPISNDTSGVSADEEATINRIMGIK